mmetsp:Transcript_7671/g.20428  ORF Transcript_7671/g.20428 Transcript_7671/m.20428 type:complete len:205 (-) Transcript_7671:2273-2887(-)
MAHLDIDQVICGQARVHVCQLFNAGLLFQLLPPCILVRPRALLLYGSLVWGTAVKLSVPVQGQAGEGQLIRRPVCQGIIYQLNHMVRLAQALGLLHLLIDIGHALLLAPLSDGLPDVNVVGLGIHDSSQLCRVYGRRHGQGSASLVLALFAGVAQCNVDQVAEQRSVGDSQLGRLLEHRACRVQLRAVQAYNIDICEEHVAFPV